MFRGLPSVNPTFLVPRHVQARHILAEAIRTGLLPAGSGLPSIASLCRQLEVSPPTMHKAIQTLVEEGWLIRHEGRVAVLRLACREPVSVTLPA